MYVVSNPLYALTVVTFTSLMSSVRRISILGIGTAPTPGFVEHPYILVKEMLLSMVMPCATSLLPLLGNDPKLITFLNTFLNVGLAAVVELKEGSGKNS